MNNVEARILIENGGGNQSAVFDVIEKVHQWTTYHDDEVVRDYRQAVRQRVYTALVYNEELNCSKFYLESGAKITRHLKPLLVKCGVTKEDLNTHWPQVCAGVGELFIQVGAKVECVNEYFWTDSVGKYGDSDSCFQDGGCNMYNGIFIDISPGCGVIKVRPDAPAADLEEYQKRARYGRGRMILWVEDSTTAWLMNMYTQYSRRELPKNIYVRALEALSGTKIVWSSASSDDAPPIFINHAPLRCKAVEGNFDKLTTNYGWKCPICKKSIRPENVFAEVDNNTYAIGCSSSCCSEQCENERWECVQCGDSVGEDEVRFVDGDAYCGDCYDRLFQYCSSCGNDEPKEDFIDVQGSRNGYVCKACADTYAFECQDCGTLWWDPDDNSVATQAGELICLQCARASYIECFDCQELVHVDATSSIDGSPYYCQSCFREEKTG